LTKEEIINILHNTNTKYKGSGFELVSLFGSYARDTADMFSDVDLTYKINHNIFFKDDAFAKLAKIDEIKKELEKKLRKKVDLIPSNTKNPLIQKSLQEEQIAI
jgi:predicted nucleotidyltransferase